MQQCRYWWTCIWMVGLKLNGMPMMSLLDSRMFSDKGISIAHSTYASCSEEDKQGQPLPYPYLKVSLQYLSGPRQICYGCVFLEVVIFSPTPLKRSLSYSNRISMSTFRLCTDLGTATAHQTVSWLVPWLNCAAESRQAHPGYIKMAVILYCMLAMCSYVVIFCDCSPHAFAEHGCGT